jgi:alkaline phosphatase
VGMPTEERFTRREILQGGLGLPLAGGLFPLSAPRRRKGDDPRQDGEVRNIIFMVSDGMSAGVPALAESFSQLVRGRSTHWCALAEDPQTARGYLQTGSLSSMVTDSSAASSAWASGSRIFNGALNVLPDGTRLVPIGPLARAEGRAIGLVTTTTITHATPAGFIAVQASRNNEADIARQYLDVVDVALGGGGQFFSPDLRKDGLDLYGEYRARGYAVCATRRELMEAGPGSKLLGCFSPGHMPYTIDEMYQTEEARRAPTLAEMTRIALQRLIRTENGFLLQVEGGRVDHAAHANDAATMLWEQIAFDDAVGEVLAFVQEHPDTLVVITTDHGNSNPGLNGMGSGYRDSTACFERLAQSAASFTTIYSDLRGLVVDGAPPPADDVIDIMRRYSGLVINIGEAEAIARVMAGGRLDDLNHQHRSIVGALGQTLGNHTGIGWTGTTHTSDLALTLALGPGRGHFATLMHHTDVYGILTSLMGIDHVNPSMTDEAAKRYAAQLRSPALEMHWV